MEFTYKISQIKVYTNDSQTDIIKEATLHIIGTEDGETYENFLPIELAEPSGSFTEFSSVSASQVEGWLTGTLGSDQIDANKEGLASMHNNANFPKGPTRDNPQNKELIE